MSNVSSIRGGADGRGIGASSSFGTSFSGGSAAAATFRSAAVSTTDVDVDAGDARVGTGTSFAGDFARVGLFPISRSVVEARVL
jgi:hypothetical protein